MQESLEGLLPLLPEGLLQECLMQKGLLQDLEARGQMAEGSAGRPREVVCDVCIGPGARRALMSCLVCLVSYCRAHLEVHNSRDRLRGHRMVPPVENLDDRACREHGRPLELYCRDSDRCICVLCVEEGREVVSVEKEWEEKRVRVLEDLTCLSFIVVIVQS